MYMKCRNCGRLMDLWEFLTYAEAYFIKIISAASIPFLIAAIKDRLSTSTKDVLGSSMAGLANNFAIACPVCKKADEPWDPLPEIEQKIKEKEQAH